MSYPQHYQPQYPQRVTTKRGANHGLHFILTILTGGLWAMTGWPIAAALGRKTTMTSAPQYSPAYPPQPYAYGPPAQQPHPAYRTRGE